MRVPTPARTTSGGEMPTLTLEERLQRAEQVLTRVADGDLGVRIDTDEFSEDAITNLEMGINFLILDLRMTAEENREKQAALVAKQRELEEKIAMIDAQAQAIRELSTPVIEVWRDVLVLPLIGVLDAERTAEVMEGLLTKVVSSGARCVIIDVTGVPTVDVGTADSLVKIVRAVGLLGARGVFTGLAPAVARTLAALSLDLGGVLTLRTLKDGLENCIAYLDELDGR